MSIFALPSVSLVQLFQIPLCKLQQILLLIDRHVVLISGRQEIVQKFWLGLLSGRMDYRLLLYVRVLEELLELAHVVDNFLLLTHKCFRKGLKQERVSFLDPPKNYLYHITKFLQLEFVLTDFILHLTKSVLLSRQSLCFHSRTTA